MKFGLAMTLEASRRAGQSPMDLYAQFLEDMEFADEAGFSTVFIGEHHFMLEPWCPSPLIAAAAVAGRTKRLRVGTAILVLPLHNPIRVAEDVAVLDVVSGGRVTLGVGQGYKPSEFDAFGVSLDARTERFVEALEILPRLWTEDDVDFEGKHFTLRGISVTPKPVQAPHPPIWIGADADPAIRRVGRMGLTYYLGNCAPLPLLARRKAVYDDARAEAGVTAPIERPLMRELYLSDSFERAWAEAGEYILWNYQHELIALGYGVPAADGTYVTNPNDPLLEPENLIRDRIIIGSPEDCIREIEKCREVMAASQINFRIYHHGLPAQLVRRSLELFVSDVMPHFPAQAGEAESAVAQSQLS